MYIRNPFNYKNPQNGTTEESRSHQLRNPKRELSKDPHPEVSPTQQWVDAVSIYSSKAKDMFIDDLLAAKKICLVMPKYK